MTESSRKKLLTAALVAVAACGVAVHLLWYPSKLSAFATLVVIVALLLLMKQAAKWQLYQLPARFPLRIPQVKAEWSLRTLGNGLLCFLAAFAWGGVIGGGIRTHILDDVSMLVAWLLLSPSIALIAIGLVLMVRGVFGKR